jgi:hypothetical protein
MTILIGFLLFLALGGAGYLGFRLLQESQKAKALDTSLADKTSQNTALEAEVQRLTPYSVIPNAEAHANQIVQDAQQQAAETGARYEKYAADITQWAGQTTDAATAQAGQIIEAAKKQEQDALQNKTFYEDTARAMKNVIEGYGDQYIIPSQSLLDELAEEFGYKEAGVELKKARAHTRDMVKQRAAAACDYVEANRRDTAVNFVVDAFNGKVDTILADIKADNAGTLEQEIRDAFALVNYNGKAFRDARITEEYLASRLTELKWAAVAQQLHIQERQEQQRIRDQMREEEKARREYERAAKEAAKEEEMIRKAVETARQQMESATAEQRAHYEQQLGVLSQQLKEAQEKGQKAVSMAQQTKKGKVYIISNVGSFGEGVFKIGQTRRIVPQDRIDELGGASVPFEFDVHAMIDTDDAPGLEWQLHNHFALDQINKVNRRKEFFRIDLAALKQEIETLGFQTKWTMAAEALEFRETLAIEKSLNENPAFKSDWLQKQVHISPSVEEKETPVAGANVSDDLQQVLA